VLQAITNHILLGEYNQRALEFQPNTAQARETTGQEKRYHAAASAEINAEIKRCSRDKVR